MKNLYVFSSSGQESESDTLTGIVDKIFSAGPLIINNYHILHTTDAPSVKGAEEVGAVLSSNRSDYTVLDPNAENPDKVQFAVNHSSQFENLFLIAPPSVATEYANHLWKTVLRRTGGIHPISPGEGLRFAFHRDSRGLGVSCKYLG